MLSAGQPNILLLALDWKSYHFVIQVRSSMAKASGPYVTFGRLSWRQTNLIEPSGHHAWSRTRASRSQGDGHHTRLTTPSKTGSAEMIGTP